MHFSNHKNKILKTSWKSCKYWQIKLYLSVLLREYRHKSKIKCVKKGNSYSIVFI